jgi:hypothetical protein
MRRNSMKDVAKDVLSVRGCPKRGKIRFFGGNLNIEVDLNLQDNQ